VVPQPLIGVLADGRFEDRQIAAGQRFDLALGLTQVLDQQRLLVTHGVVARLRAKGKDRNHRRTRLSRHSGEDRMRPGGVAKERHLDTLVLANPLVDENADATTPFELGQHLSQNISLTEYSVAIQPPQTSKLDLEEGVVERTVDHPETALDLKTDHQPADFPHAEVGGQKKGTSVKAEGAFDMLPTGNIDRSQQLLRSQALDADRLESGTAEVPRHRSP
jgi:hypothetical protein